MPVTPVISAEDIIKEYETKDNLFEPHPSDIINQYYSSSDQLDDAMLKDVKEPDYIRKIADQYFDKPKAPMVAKPEIYKPPVMSPQERIDDADQQVLDQETITLRNLRRDKNRNANAKI